MRFIGIAGEAGSGKTTLAQVLLKNNIVHQVVGFADGVKALTKEYFDAEGRFPWQIVGQGMRDLGSKILGHDRMWIDYLDRKCKSLDPCAPYKKYDEDGSFTIKFINPLFAIADVRYLNEARWLLDNGHALVILSCRSPIRRSRIEQRDDVVITMAEWEQQQRHPSETGVKEIRESILHNEITKTLWEGVEKPVSVFWNNSDFTNRMHLLEIRFMTWFKGKFERWLKK